MRLHVLLPLTFSLLLLTPPAWADLTRAKTATKPSDKLTLADVPPTNLDQASVSQLIDWLDPVMRLLATFHLKGTAGNETEAFSLVSLGIATDTYSWHLSQMILQDDKADEPAMTSTAKLPVADIDSSAISILTLSIADFLNPNQSPPPTLPLYQTSWQVKGKTESDGRMLHIVRIPLRPGTPDIEVLNIGMGGPLMLPHSSGITAARHFNIPCVDRPAAEKIQRALTRLHKLHTTAGPVGADAAATELEPPSASASPSELSEWLERSLSDYGAYHLVFERGTIRTEIRARLEMEFDPAANRLTISEIEETADSHITRTVTTIHKVALHDLDPAAISVAADESLPKRFRTYQMTAGGSAGSFRGWYEAPAWLASRPNPEEVQFVIITIPLKPSAPDLTVLMKIQDSDRPDVRELPIPSRSLDFAVSSSQSADVLIDAFRRLCDSAQ